MAAPTKKSTLNGRRESSRNMAREEQQESVELYDDSMYSVTEASPPPKKRSASDKKLEKLVEDMVEAAPRMLDLVTNCHKQRNRHRIRKQAVHKTYTTSQSDLKNKITLLFSEHESQAANVHKIQLARLTDLLRQKCDIETLMSKKQVALRKAYVAHSEALEGVIRRHVKELH